MERRGGAMSATIKSQDYRRGSRTSGRRLSVRTHAGAKLAGVLVTLDYHGKVEIHRGLIRSADKKALKALPKAEGASEGARAAGGADEDESASLSGALRMNLSAHFTAGLQARLDASPGVALRLGGGSWGTVARQTATSVIECPVKLPRYSAELGESRAGCAGRDRRTGMEGVASGMDR